MIDTDKINLYFLECQGGKIMGSSFYHPRFGKKDQLLYHQSWDWIMDLFQYLPTDKFGYDKKIEVERNVCIISSMDKDINVSGKGTTAIEGAYDCFYRLLNKYHAPGPVTSMGEPFDAEDLK
jgi:hypothetical protein